MNRQRAKSFAIACIYALAPFALVVATLWWAKSDAFRSAKPSTPAPYFDEKLDVLNRRVARTEKVAASNPSSVEAALDYLQSLFDRGSYIRLTRPAGTSADEGIDDVIRAAELAEKVAAQNPRLWLPSARCCAFLNKAADFLSQRNRGDDRERAILFLKRAIETSTRFLVSNPKAPELLAAASSAHLSLGNALARRGGKNDLVEAQERLEEGLRIAEQELAAFPTSNDARSRVISGLESLGDYFANRGIVGDLVFPPEYFRKAVAIAEGSHNFAPESAAARDSLADRLSKLGDFLMRRGGFEDDAEALALFKRSLDLRKKSLDQNPRSVVAMWGVANELRRIAEAEEKLGGEKLAEARWRECYDLLRMASGLSAEAEALLDKLGKRFNKEP